MGSIIEKKRKNGKKSYTAQVRLRGHPPLNKTFDKKALARLWIADIETKIKTGRYEFAPTEATKHMFEDAVERYIRENECTGIRLTHYKRWKEAFKNLYLSSINPVKVNDTTSHWKHAGINGKKPMAATLNRHLVSLSVLFRAAKEWGWIERNPVSEAKRYQEPKGRVRYLSDDEREALLEACRESYYKPLYFVVVLALSTGMRKNELRFLRWADIDLKTGTIILTKTKNKECRRVEVQGLALELLREHAKVRQLNSPFLFPAKQESRNPEYETIPVDERPFDFRKAWERALKKAEIENFRFHDLRHSCASYLAMNGASLLEIAEVLGHKQVEVVRRYAHLSETHIKGVMADLSKKIFGQ